MSRNTPWRTTRGMLALHEGKYDWFRLRNLANGGPTQLHIYDEIGFFGKKAMDLVQALADVDGPIDLHINSPGGEVFEGLAIYNTLQARGNITVYIDGLAASIASVIAMAGNPVLIARQATLMIHEGYSSFVGDAEDARDLAANLDRQSNNIAQIYSARSGRSVKYCRDLMKAETWLSADEAIEMGLCDRYIPGGQEPVMEDMANKWDLSVFRRPGRMAAAMKDAAAVPWVSERQSRHEPTTTHHSHDHAAFGHDDHDDGVHNHDHSHENDASHDHDHTHLDGGDTGDGNVHGHSHSGEMGNKARGTYLDLVSSRYFNEKYSQADRDRMAKSGEAMEDGSYPIGDEEDLHNAVSDIGRGKNNSKAAIKSHIIKRAKAMGKESALPEDWTNTAGLSISDEEINTAILAMRALKGA